MLLTFDGIEMEVNPLQPPKADAPILVTLDGIIVVLQPTINTLFDF